MRRGLRAAAVQATARIMAVIDWLARPRLVAPDAGRAAPMRRED
jgi:hypothetical protein